MRAGLGAAALALAFVQGLRGMDPVPTWFYVFAWYPTLVLLDSCATLLDGSPSLFARPALALSLFLWSPIVWLVFEAANFRLQDWYYVLLPAHAAERWAGILLSFATVVPAIVLAERALASAGVFRAGRGPRLAVRRGDLWGAVALGVGMGILALRWPRLFFPLVWGAAFLLAEPVAYARLPDLSLFRDVERGQWGRVGRVMLGGLGVGVLWETFNHVAQARWIYTVPWLEELKLFEMPPLGFIGFPVFALEAWAMYGALAGLGVAVPPAGTAPRRARRTLGAGLLAAAFAVAVLLGMERYTISSVASRAAAGGGHSNGAPEPGGAGHALAELAALRGMGWGHARTLMALGVGTRCELARAAAEPLAARMRAATGRRRPTAAEVRVWVRAAERSCPRPMGSAAPGSGRSRPRPAVTSPHGLSRSGEGHATVRYSAATPSAVSRSTSSRMTG